MQTNLDAHRTVCISIILINVLRAVAMVIARVRLATLTIKFAHGVG